MSWRVNCYMAGLFFAIDCSFSNAMLIDLICDSFFKYMDLKQIYYERL